MASIATIIREQRKSLNLSLNKLSELSGVSVAHLGRIEQGLRRPSTRTLRKIASPLEFDFYELLIATGHLLPDESSFSDEHIDKLRIELNTLLDRVGADIRRIKVIINRLSLSR